ncbi:MAG: hypothetical protein ACFFDF_15790 [Candidatus Odinarchaeota archaeon]
MVEIKFATIKIGKLAKYVVSAILCAFFFIINATVLYVIIKNYILFSYKRFNEQVNNLWPSTTPRKYWLISQIISTIGAKIHPIALNFFPAFVTIPNGLNGKFQSQS